MQKVGVVESYSDIDITAAGQRQNGERASGSCFKLSKSQLPFNFIEQMWFLIHLKQF